MSAPSVETVMDGPVVIALVVRAGFDEPGTRFLTPPDFTQQLAVMKHPAGTRIRAHAHAPVRRRGVRTQEVVLIRKGRVRATLYSSRRERLCSPVLVEGDIILLCGGGHAFEMLEESVMVEVKQGPYDGPAEKIEFESSRGAAGHDPVPGSRKP
jgi:hypothetical protein